MDSAGSSPWVLISPVRNEAATIGRTLASVLAQTALPLRWIILDDGSRDETAALVEEQARRHAFIRLVRLPDRGARLPGPGVVHAFNRGLEELKDLPWEFVGKLDGDIEAPDNYYERLLKEFTEDPHLGIASGSCRVPDGAGGFRLEKSAPFHTRGPCKVYRRTCFEEIGGLIPTLGWDGLDGYRARMKGWRTGTLPGLSVLHLRPTASGEGAWRGSLRTGRGAYAMHYRLDYLLARGALALFRPPYLVGGVGMVLGFLGAHLQKLPRWEDPETVEYIQQEQRQRLWRL